MNAELKSIEVEPALVSDDEFAVEDGFWGELLAKGIDHFGEISIEGFLIPALDEDFVAIPKDEHAKAVPLGLVDPLARRRHVVDALRQHGQQGRIDGEVHIRRCCSQSGYTHVQMPESSHGVVRRLSRIRDVWQTTIEF